ncbi:hypothetical protein DAEQUDRAFT_255768 [Daedalea quercina L-15889]|uniref:Uncharacterized protein n=1 Tax=Daedalea quercina L-15889 TaxID=1314783 RepID=A0A165QIR2_9APHY|nr:hypothetical protein DAEQUDRAFT_255768 [Daedalea quercina L-15889]
MEDHQSRQQLQRTIVDAHASAMYEERRVFPEFSSNRGDVEVAENVTFQAYRDLGLDVLPLYLRYVERRTVPILVLVFDDADVLATQSIQDDSRAALGPEYASGDSNGRSSYTLFDLLCSSLRPFTEDGLRAVFVFKDPSLLNAQQEVALSISSPGNHSNSLYGTSRSHEPGIYPCDMPVRAQVMADGDDSPM